MGGDPTGTGGTGGGGPGCGDGTVTAGEQCDDGNANGGDGCSATCEVELSDGCPDVDLVLGTTPVTFMGDTNVAQNDLSGSCGGTSSGDYIFSIQPSLTGTLMATLQGNFSSGNQKVLWIQPQCPANQFQSLACDSGSPAQLSFPVTQGMAFYLGVDGESGAEGQFQLTMVIQ
jgi:cysteine-rich repeat protein